MTTTARSSPFQAWRYLVVYGLLGAVVMIFVGRLFSLQILQGTTFLQDAENNRTERISIPPLRGIIYDRNGIILARNIASYNIVITPANLPDDYGDVQRIYRALSELTGVEVGTPVVDPLTDESLNAAKLVAPCVPGPSIIDIVTLGESNAPYDPVKIQCNVGEQIAMIVREHGVEWPGVEIEIEPVRDYPTGSLTANLVGFLGPIPANLEQVYRDRGFLPNRDKVGYYGVEYSLNDVLLGRPGHRTVEVDVAGQELRNLEAPAAAVPGQNVVLTIDTRLQQAAEAALLRSIDYWNNVYNGYERITSGLVVAMNPKTGEILAMAQYPTYENNRMARIIPGYYWQQLSQDPRHPLLNFAISTEYSPGSTFKLATALGVLNEGVVAPDTEIDAPSFIGLTNAYSPTDAGILEYYYDWTYTFYGITSGLGRLPFLKCIALSSDVCFYKVGGGYTGEVDQGLGILRLKQYAQALGYNLPSGIELPGEQGGLVPDPAWKRIFRGEYWSTGDTYLASVGQGYVLSTPLQVLMSAAAIANDGRLMQPTIIHEILDGEGNVVQPFQPRLRWDMTADPIIQDYRCDNVNCVATDHMKPVQMWAVQAVQSGMRQAATDPRGTLNHDFSFQNYPIAVAGKTGTAEYCDDVARAKNICQRGEWPSHGWTVVYAPYDDPEIAIIAFLYNAGEGGRVAAPIVRDVMNAYFEIKTIDAARGQTGSPFP
jgi:penicillin-binding protein 2